MAGVKGKSGRGSWDKEIQSKELWNLSIPVLKHALKSNNKSLYMKKIDIALALVNKMLPQKIQGDPDNPIFQFITYGDTPSTEKL